MPGPVCTVPSVMGGTLAELKSMTVGRMNRGRQQSFWPSTAHAEPPAGITMGRMGKRAEGGKRKPSIPLVGLYTLPTHNGPSGRPDCSPGARVGQEGRGPGRFLGCPRRGRRSRWLRLRGTEERLGLWALCLSHSLRSQPLLTLSNKAASGLSQLL